MLNKWKLIAHASRVRSLATVITLLAALLPPLSAAADSVPSLSGPVRVELKDGRSFSGRPVSFLNDVLTVRAELDGGQVNRGFPRANIARLHFPGTRVVATAIELVDDGELIQALPHLEAIWRQRSAFFALLEPETLDLLSALPAAHLAAGDAYRAIALARNLLPHPRAPRVKNRLHEIVLLGNLQLELFDDVEELARNWIGEQEDFPASALGWKVLGDLALRDEDFERVAWIALQPVATAGPQPIEHLDGCYALAIHAFHRLENFGRAARLHREMLDRDLPWPPDTVLAETGEFYRAEVAETARKKTAAAEPDLDLRPPEEDLNLPIQDVRKILRAENP